MFMVVVEDDQIETVTNSVQAAASTGFPGDGRVFVTTGNRPLPCEHGNPGCDPVVQFSSVRQCTGPQSPDLE